MRQMASGSDQQAMKEEGKKTVAKLNFSLKPEIELISLLFVELCSDCIGLDFIIQQFYDGSSCFAFKIHSTQHHMFPFSFEIKIRRWIETMKQNI